MGQTLCHYILDHFKLAAEMAVLRGKFVLCLSFVSSKYHRNGILCHEIPSLTIYGMFVPMVFVLEKTITHVQDTPLNIMSLET